MRNACTRKEGRMERWQGDDNKGSVEKRVEVRKVRGESSGMAVMKWRMSKWNRVEGDGWRWTGLDGTGRRGREAEPWEETVGEDSERYRNKDPRPKTPRVLYYFSRHFARLALPGTPKHDAKAR